MAFSISHISDESVSTIKELALDKLFDLTFGSSLGFIGITLASFATNKAFEFFSEPQEKPSDCFIKTQGKELLGCAGQNLYFMGAGALGAKSIQRFLPNQALQKILFIALSPLLQMGWKVLNGEPVTQPSLKDLALATVSGLGNLRMGVTDQHPQTHQPAKFDFEIIKNLLNKLKSGPPLETHTALTDTASAIRSHYGQNPHYTPFGINPRQLEISSKAPQTPHLVIDEHQIRLVGDPPWLSFLGCSLDSGVTLTPEQKSKACRLATGYHLFMKDGGRINLHGNIEVPSLTTLLHSFSSENLTEAQRTARILINHTPQESKLTLKVSGDFKNQKPLTIEPEPNLSNIDPSNYCYVEVNLSESPDNWGISDITTSIHFHETIASAIYPNTSIPIAFSYRAKALAGYINHDLGLRAEAISIKNLTDILRAKNPFLKAEQAISVRPLSINPDSTPEQFVLHISTTFKTAGNEKMTASFETYDPATFKFGKDRNMALIVEMSPEGKVVVKEIIRCKQLTPHEQILDALGISEHDRNTLTTGLVQKERAPKASSLPQVTHRPDSKPELKPKPKESKPEEVLDPSPSSVLAHQPSVQFQELHTQWVKSSPQINSTDRRAIEIELKDVENLLAQIESKYPHFYQTRLASIQRWYRIHSSGKTNAQNMLGTIQERKKEIAIPIGKSTDTHRMAS